MAEETEVEEEGGLRSQMWKHEAMVEWINDQDEVDLDTLSAADVIAYAFARRVAWRQSDVYKSLVAGRAEIVEAEKAERAKARDEAKEAKAAERAEAKAKKDAEAKAKAAEAEKGKEPTKAAKATKATKATKKTTGGKGAAASEDSPFE